VQPGEFFMKTRDRIKATAVKLFNEKGATNVSTVQIADKMGISPGNLYYYFTNKEHIIRSIWEEDMVPVSDHIFLDFVFDDPEIVLTKMQEQLVQYGIQYSFFFTEQYTIFQNDPNLQEKYRKRWDGLVDKLTDTFVHWQEQGFMRSSTRAWKRELVEYFLTASAALFRANLIIHPEYTIKEALHKAMNGVVLIVSGDFVDEVCENMLARLKS
jgi:AcrR family transcriptional regulator